MSEEWHLVDNAPWNQQYSITWGHFQCADWCTPLAKASQATTYTRVGMFQMGVADNIRERSAFLRTETQTLGPSVSYLDPEMKEDAVVTKSYAHAFAEAIYFQILFTYSLSHDQEGLAHAVRGFGRGGGATLVQHGVGFCDGSPGKLPNFAKAVRSIGDSCGMVSAGLRLAKFGQHGVDSQRKYGIDLHGNLSRRPYVALGDARHQQQRQTLLWKHTPCKLRHQHRRLMPRSPSQPGCKHVLTGTIIDANTDTSTDV